VVSFKELKPSVSNINKSASIPEGSIEFLSSSFSSFSNFGGGGGFRGGGGGFGGGGASGGW
jgi:uncharacterized membrane protein YgcG